MPQRVTVRAYAKINLHLRIGERDARTGYHTLETLFQTVGLFDTLRLTPAPDLRLVGAVGDAPRDGSNLVLRAARALGAATGTERGARIHLTKRIPMAAGMGGGSSDAAAALYGLNILWGTGLTNIHLMSIAKRLGADVPFLLHGGCAMGTRWGDRLGPVPHPWRPWWVLLVTSSAGVGTAEAYGRLRARDRTRALRAGNRRPSAELRTLAKAWGRGDWPQTTVNSFERVLFESWPRLRAVVDRLRHLGAVQAQVSGSGPTVFGLFPTAASARAAAARFRPRRREAVHVTRPVAASPVLVRLDKTQGLQ